ncbi:FixH family protein [Halorarum salinum]|uniref:FixH family protein n=1 Tax=Halorarum salinum TaxID=2743089 RepID=A0A7D5QDD3_9EURY|nr:FixH family protein [Halobaculum salinum]
MAVGAAGPALAHEEQTVEGYDLTFGAADEPVITDERTRLTLEILDNETDEPVDGQAGTLQVSVQGAGGEKTPLNVSERHGEPGVYEAAVVFTEPGQYVVHVEGSLDGTEIHTHFEKEVHDRADLEYPGDADETDDDGTESAPDGDDGTESAAGSEGESGTDGNENDVRGDGPDDGTDRAGLLAGADVGVAAAVIAAVLVVGALRLRR